MEPAAAEHDVARLGSLEVEVRVAIPGEPDAAVDLDVLAQQHGVRVRPHLHLGRALRACERVLAQLRHQRNDIDRLARSIGDLQYIVRKLKAKGVALKATEQPIDTSTAAGKAFLDMLGVFAEFETNLRRERQLEGIAAAKAAGVYKGRPATIEAAEIAKLKAEGLGATEIAKRLGIGRASVYRLLAA